MKSIIKNLKKLLPHSTLTQLKKCRKFYYTYTMQKKSKSVKAFMKDAYPYGINLIGDIRVETGLGQSMRMVARLLENAKIPFMVKQMDVPGKMERQERGWDNKIEEKNRYGINILHINNNIWEESYNQIPLGGLSGRYNIAYWLWELENFPEEWKICIDTVDEIWTPAEFVSKSIREKTDKPVITMPYGMELDMNYLLDRDYFGLPEDVFLFLVMYDFQSVSERKNPRGAIEAYKSAFDVKNKGIGLVIKINHLVNEEELNALKRELQDYSNIFFITNSLSRKEVESLIAAVDVLVSLHRAEGFGLALAEAMYLGTAVIATNWSATVEFMNEESACLVDYSLITLERDIGPYRKGNRWADADTKQAAEFMQKLSKDKLYFDKKIATGKQHIRVCLNSDVMSTRISDRIIEIYKSGKD